MQEDQSDEPDSGYFSAICHQGASIMTNHPAIPASMFLLSLISQSALGHVTVAPRYSPPGESVTYSVRVPSERQSPTVGLEAEFPVEAMVIDFEFAEEWTIEPLTDADGKIIGAVWSGSSIPRGESVQFRLTARNPAQETTLVWRMVQILEDGSRVQWAPDTIVGAPESEAQ
jgi:uncharacterized protein YcnI